MGGTLLAPPNLGATRRLGTVAPYCDGYPQQFPQLDDQGRPNGGALGLLPATILPTNPTLKKPKGGGLD